jgi:signal transduction histidine kinase
MFQSVLVTFYLIGCLGTKEERKKTVLFVGIIATFTYLYIQNKIAAFESGGILLYLVISLTYSFIFLGGSILRKFMYNMLLLLIVVFSAVIAGSLVGMICRNGYIELVSEDSLYRTLAMILNQIILLFFVWIIIKIAKAMNGVYNPTYTVLSLLIPGITILLCCIILQIADGSRYQFVYTIFAIAGLIVLNIINLMLLVHEQKRYNDQLRESMMLTAYQHQKKDVAEIQRVYDENEKTRHEINKVINMASYLLEKDKIEDAKNYLKEFAVEKVVQAEEVFYTDNVILNHLLNRKIEQCNKMNIPVKCMINGVINGISDLDLHILIENLLDNAIEATQKLKEKNISIEIYANADSIGIMITNTSEHSILQKNPNFHTTKKEAKGHGFGLQNVKDVVNKYHGKIEYSNIVHDVVTCKVVLIKNVKREQ